MVRVTSLLFRVPVIKFRKGGLGQAAHSSAGRATATGAQSSPSAASQSPSQQSAAGMSTSCVPDIDLPLRYRRLPLSEEEIDHINGGGIV